MAEVVLNQGGCHPHEKVESLRKAVRWKLMGDERWADHEVLSGQPGNVEEGPFGDLTVIFLL
ncbi:conserved hypothetical protein [Ricinus communis]|uniref:Uncharacterized protein n=1 Tax=Ricinus communis TaxID=3988 RepID=B9R790_RICCO|nr:conserved hypothetical protein [Ricinus communis]